MTIFLVGYNNLQINQRNIFIALLRENWKNTPTLTHHLNNLTYTQNMNFETWCKSELHRKLREMNKKS